MTTKPSLKIAVTNIALRMHLLINQNSNAFAANLSPRNKAIMLNLNILIRRLKQL